MNFVGELFKNKLLKYRILCTILEHLLVKSKSASDIECACVMLETIGSTVNNMRVKDEKNRAFLSLIWSNIESFTRIESNLPNRIRFRCLELLDLKNNNWVPRFKKAQAKTISEIHEEAEKQQKEERLSNLRYNQEKRRSLLQANRKSRFSIHGNNNNNNKVKKNHHKKNHHHLYHLFHLLKKNQMLMNPKKKKIIMIIMLIKKNFIN